MHYKINNFRDTINNSNSNKFKMTIYSMLFHTLHILISVTYIFINYSIVCMLYKLFHILFQLNLLYTHIHKSSSDFNFSNSILLENSTNFIIFINLLSKRHSQNDKTSHAIINSKFVYKISSTYLEKFNVDRIIQVQAYCDVGNERVK